MRSSEAGFANVPASGCCCCCVVLSFVSVEVRDHLIYENVTKKAELLFRISPTSLPLHNLAPCLHNYSKLLPEPSIPTSVYITFLDRFGKLASNHEVTDRSSTDSTCNKHTISPQLTTPARIPHDRCYTSAHPQPHLLPPSEARDFRKRRERTLLPSQSKIVKPHQTTEPFSISRRQVRPTDIQQTGKNPHNQNAAKDRLFWLGITA